MPSPPLSIHPTLDWCTTTFVGFCVVSYWRCTWVLMDIWHCKQPTTANLVDGDSFCWFIPSIDDVELAQLRINTARLSYGVGIACLTIGVFIVWMGWWVPEQPDYIANNAKTPTTTTTSAAAVLDNTRTTVTPVKAVVRFLTVYCLGFSAVNLWRGIWYWADYWILPTQPLASYWLTSVVGSTVAFLLWGGNSLLAPPAIFLLDGPGLSSPPIAVTLLSSHYAITLPAGQKPPPLSIWMKIADIFLSFIVLPFAVVWFWRGTWLLFDVYLWGLTPSNQDVNYSILWCFILAYGLYMLTCEPVMGLIDRCITQRSCIDELLGRFRTYLLAWATVAFWRGVWLIWDQFLGGTTSLSAGVGHVCAVVVLTLMGCISSICAPASTMGVDSAPNPDAADEPLFSMLPVPYDCLYFVGIGRNPNFEDKTPIFVDGGPIGENDEIEMMKVSNESDRNADVHARRKTRPSRFESDLEGIGDNVNSSALDESKGLTEQPKLDVEDGTQVQGDDAGEAADSVPPLPMPMGSSIIRPSDAGGDTGDGGEDSSSRRHHTARGWQANGTFRSYGELQRSGPVRFHSDYQQRPSFRNKRMRSSHFRSR